MHSNLNPDDSSAFFATPQQLVTRDLPPERIGGSGSGLFEIWRIARDGKFRVLKCLSPDYRTKASYVELLKREFSIGYSLSNPFICEVFSFAEHPELGPCIEMEWIDGIPLQEHLASSHLPAKGKRKIADQLLDAVGYIHSKQIVHKDCK